MMRTDTPDVSVIIPTFNRAHTLARTIESILNQTMKSWECIVVDDGSDDDTETLVRSYVEKDKRLSFYKRPSDRKKGANACRNIGIMNARGHYVTFLDSDDEYLPDHLSRRLAHLRETGAPASYGAAYVFDGEQRRITKLRQKAPEESWFDFLLQHNVVTSTLFLERPIAAATLFDETLLRHQDWDFLMRLPTSLRVAFFSEPTFVIHWIKHERRNIHFESCIEVYTRYRDTITVKNPRKRYLFNMYEKAVNYGTDKSIRNFYRDELLRLFTVYSRAEKFKLFFPGLYKSLRQIYLKMGSVGT